jgi:dTDP-4-amino-4,6-dideoxygalactose transaminase
VEDAAHALGASAGGAAVGACQSSDATTFSFHPVKHVTTGEGGAITTRRPDLKRKLDLLREHGIERKPAEGSLGHWGYEQNEHGFNYRLSDIAGALGSSQLDKLPAFVRRRREIAARYRAGFADLDPALLRCPGEPAGRDSSYHLFAVQIDFARLGLTRGQLMAALKARGVGSQVHYIPVCDQPYYASRAASHCPKAREFYARELSLPMYASLSDADVERVISAVVEVIERPTAAAV